MKRLLALVLSICLTLSCLPFQAIAVEAEQEVEVVTEPVAEATEAPAQAAAEETVEAALPAQVEETAPVLQAEHTAHGACICAISGAACSHEQLTWTLWPDTDKLPTDAGNYYLTGKVTLAATTTINANVKICLNGFDIDLNQKRIVVNGGGLTIMNCQAELNSKNQLSSTAGRVYNGRSTNKTNSGINYMGGAIGTKAPLTLIAIHLDNNQCDQESDARSGGAIYADQTTVVMESCSFKDNYSMGSGGVYASYGGNLTVKDCLFTNNHGARRGGAISMNTANATAASNLTITGNSEFTGNRTTSTGTTVFYGCGGAIFAFKNAAHDLNVTIGGNTKITGNTTSQEGGGICIRNKSGVTPTNIILQDNVQIYGNTATNAPFHNIYFEDTTQKVTIGTLGQNAKIYISPKTGITDPDSILALASGATVSENVLTGIFYENDDPDKEVAYNTTDKFYFPSHTHQSCICAITGDECSSHGNTAVWTAWESKDSLPTEAGNYYLTDKVTLAVAATINANVKICLNGFDIDLNKKSIVLNGAGDLTLLNCKATLKTNGQLDENNAKITGGNAIRGGAISVAKGGKLTAIGVEFYKNVQQRDTQASGQGGGAIHSEGTATLKACRFIENSSNNCGGAVSAYVHATLNVDDCYFSGNSAVTGGALSAYTDSNTRANVVVTITGDTEFVANTATSNGGAIFNWRASSTLEDYALKLIIKDNTKISGNHSEAVGGGIYMNNKGTTIEISGNVNVTGNTAKTKAPNVYLWDKNTHKLVLSALGAGASIGIFTGDNFAAADPDEFLTLASGATLADTENTGIFWDRSDPAKVIGYNATEKFYFVKDPLPPHKHGACSCGITGATCNHTELNWQPWESTDSLPTTEGSYYLLDDVKLTGTVTIAENVNLCLNGHSINLNGKKIHNDGNLTVMNCQATVNEKNQLTSTTGKIYGGLGSSLSTHIYGGAISTGGSMTLIGVWFADNTAKGADARTGGALYVEDGVTTITSCKFSGNQALSDTSTNKNKGVGGAISVYINGSLDITDSVFENNTADLYGGAICVNNRNATKDTSVTIDGNCSFTGNKTNSTTDGYGSALYLYCREESADTLYVTIGGNTQITGNTAGKYGAVCLRTKAAANPLNITVSGDVNISGNTASDAQRANLYFFDSGYTMQVGQLGTNAKLFVSTPSEVGDPDTFLQLAQNVTLADTQDTHIVYDRAEPDAVVAYNTNSSVKFYFAGEYDLNHNGHGVCLCTANGSQCAHEQVVWQPWLSKTSLPSTAGNWYLTCDVTLSAKADITGKVNLCLNGYSVDLNKKYINLTGGDDLTILNCEAVLSSNGQLAEGNAKITNGKHTHGAAAVVAIGAKMTAMGVEFSKNVNERTDGNLYEGQGGGAIQSEGELNLYACRFIENSSNNNGGAITVYKGTALMDDCYFSGNTAAKAGGAVSVYTGSSNTESTVATITGSTEFVGNTARTNGGAIIVNRHKSNTNTAVTAKLILDGDIKITGNTAKVNADIADSGNGGGIYLHYAYTVAEVHGNVQITGNTAERRGSNVYLWDTTQRILVGELEQGASIGVTTGSNFPAGDPDEFLQVADGVTLSNTDKTGIYFEKDGAVKDVAYSTHPAVKFYFAGESYDLDHKDHGVCLCTMNGSQCAHEQVIWQPWLSKTSLPTTAGNWYLTGDVTISATHDYRANVNICLNGYDINLNGKHLNVFSDALTVMNCETKLDAQGRYSSGSKIYGGSGATGGAIAAYYNDGICATVNAYGIEFADNEATSTDGGKGGGALYVAGKANIYACRFTDNKASHGGAIAAYKNGIVTADDSIFTGNEAASGGAISMYTDENTTNTSCVTITGDSEITGSKATNNGGAIFVWRRTNTKDEYTAKLVLKDNTKITGNTTEGNGGGVYPMAAGSVFAFSGNVQITGNTAGAKGNNVYLFDKATHKITVGTIGPKMSIGVFTGDNFPVVDPDNFLSAAKGAKLQDTQVTGIVYENTEPAMQIGYSKEKSERFYFVVEAAGEHVGHNICQCYLNGKECDHEQKNWKPWPYTDRLPTTAGYWYLTGDVKVADLNGGSTGIFEVGAGEKVRLCLNGHNVIFNKDNTEKANYYVKPDGDLVIINCKAVLDKQGKLDTEKSEGGKLTGGNTIRTLEDGVYNGGKAGAIYSAGTLRLVGVHLTGNSADNMTATGQGGGAVYVENGTAEVLYCALTNNKTTGHGGAITLYRNGQLTVENSLIADNEARYGGAISVYANVETKQDNLVLKVLANTTITGNSALKNGGGIHVERNSNATETGIPVLTINNAVINNNTSEGNGGGIVVINPKDQIRMAMTETEISGNKAKLGGGMYLEHTKLVGTTVTVSDNNVEAGGAGIYAMAAEITLQTDSWISGNKTTGSGGGGIHASNASIINLYNCTVTKNESPDGGGVRIWRESVLNMRGGKITENHSTSVGGGLSMVKGSILNFELGEISQNTCVKNGAGIYADNFFQTTDPEYDLPQLNLTGGRISGNSTPGSYGGGIYAKNCKVELSGTKITGNKAEKGNGGGIYASKVEAKVEEEVFTFKPTFTMTGGEVSGNKSKNGGGIYFNDLDATISGGAIKNNTASDNAGGISVRTAKLTLKGSALVSGNKGKSGGGIIVQVQSELDMQGGTVEKNSAKNGGGILLWSRSVVNVRGGNIRSNKATKGSGGGIYAQGGAQVNLKGGRVGYNSATSKGGGIYATNTDGYTTRFTVSGGTIIGNTAQHGGGAYTNKGAVTNTYGGLWTENESEVCGGAFYVEASPANFYGGTFTKNHAIDCGGAINGKKAEILLDGATITENISDARGGGLRIYNECVFTMKSGVVNDNQAARAGGGIGFQNCTAYIEGGEICGNKVTGSELYPTPIGGGAINVAEGSNVYSQLDTLVEISGGKIAENYSPTDGGAIFLSGRTVMNITGGEIINNVAAGNGGAVMSHPRHTNSRTARATLNVTGGKISGNTATDGGALYVCYTGALNLDGATIEGNTASGIGGAVYLGRGTKASLKDSLLTDNKAAQGAGFYAIDDLTMHNLEVTNNDSGSGYAVYIDRGEFDGRSYVLSLIKMTGDIRIHGNHSTDMFIGKDAKINVGLEGLGKNTLINVDLEHGVLTNTIIGAYNYEGGNQKYVVTYGDRSLTDLEPIPVEETQPEETQPATEPAEVEVKPGTPVILPVVLGVAVLAIIAAIVLILLKRKKNGKKN